MWINEELLKELARGDAERVCERSFAWLPPRQQQEIVAAMTRIVFAGLTCYCEQYRRLTEGGPT